MLSDVLNFTQKMTFRKLWNLLIVQLSFFLSGLLKIPIVWGKPWFVSIEPASVCNLACPQCPVGEADIFRERKYMNLDEYEKLLKEISGTTAMLSLYFQGEPFMNKDVSEFVSLANRYGIYTQTSTNGQLLTEDVCRGMIGGGLDRIIISLDGMDQESYQVYRKGGDLYKLETGIRNLNRIRSETGTKTPYIIVQFLVFKHNIDQIPLVKKKAIELGADVVKFKTAQVEYPQTAVDWIPDGSQYNRYEKDSKGKWKIRGSLKNRCKRLWQTTVVTSDGIIVPCCFDKRAEFSMGQTPEQGLGEIWKSKTYQDFRKQVLRNRKEIGICTNCTEGIRKPKRSLHPSP